MKKALIIIAAIGASLLVLIGGGIALLVFGVMQLTSGLVDSAEGFFHAATNENMAAVQEFCSDGFKSATSEEQLEQFLKQTELNQFESVSWYRRAVENSSGELAGTLKTKTGRKIKVELDLVKENDAWKIQRLDTDYRPSGIASDSSPTSADQANTDPAQPGQAQTDPDKTGQAKVAGNSGESSSTASTKSASSSTASPPTTTLGRTVADDPFNPPPANLAYRPTGMVKTISNPQAMPTAQLETEIPEPWNDEELKISDEVDTLREPEIAPDMARQAEPESSSIPAEQPRESATTGIGVGLDGPISQTKATELANETFRNFALSVKEKDFTRFHQTTDQLFQDQISLEKFTGLFEGFIKQDVDLTHAFGAEPQFDFQPKLDDQGLLILQGYYPVQPQPLFKYSFIDRGGEWKLISVNIKISGEPLPRTEAIKLTNQTMEDFALSVRDKDFSRFHKTTDQVFQEQIPLEKFTEIFAAFIDQDIDLTHAIGVNPEFEFAPKFDDDGLLVLKGVYPVNPEVQFEFSFIQREAGWKLVAVDVVKEAAK